ncbi:MAG: OB-fold nucleic acid binding domain-containing protein [Bauldia sp.]
MPLGEHVVNDYRYLSLSLKAHPLSFLRGELTARGILADAALRALPNNRRVTVAGLVLTRQRPGTAKGVIFMTLEDETDIANIIVWPKVFERFRPVVLGARPGRGHRQGAKRQGRRPRRRRHDRGPHFRCLPPSPAKAPSSHRSPRADEVARPGVDQREKQVVRARLAALREVMPKGRNFH